MKGKYVSGIAAIIILISLIASCSKSNPTVFSWDYLGRHYVADSSSVSSTNKIAAYAGSGLAAIGIQGGLLLNVGSYTLHPQNVSGDPYLIYFQLSSHITSQSGMLNVIARTNNSITGNFSSTLTDGTIISGSFTDIPIR